MILEIGTLAATAVGYIIGGIKNSKGLKEASDDISTEIWKWIKPIFIKEGKEKTVEKIEKNPDKYKSSIEIAIEEIAEKDKKFADELEKWLKKTPKGSKLIAERIKGKDGVEFKAKLKNSEGEIKDIESENGKVNFDIDLS